MGGVVRGFRSCEHLQAILAERGGKASDKVCVRARAYECVCMCAYRMPGEGGGGCMGLLGRERERIAADKGGQCAK